MRSLRIVTALIALCALFLVLAYSGYRAFARRQARALELQLARLPDTAAHTPYPKTFFQRGVNFTAEFPAFYGSDAAVEMLRKLPAHGVNSVALVPYGFASLKEPQVRGWNTRWEGDAGVTQLARVAHSLGMKVLLKPQLWMHGGNPADIDFPGAAENAQWFVQYLPFLEHYAELATAIHADVLCVGVELEKMSANEQAWRKLIARAREIYPGPLTYAANFGPEFEGIKFWDALDYIGVDEYYPLPDDLSAATVVEKISVVQARYQKPVLFTEAGFASVPEANRAPWDDPSRRWIWTSRPKVTTRCSPRFTKSRGSLVSTGGKSAPTDTADPTDSSHTPWNKPAMVILDRWYRSGRR